MDAFLNKLSQIKSLINASIFSSSNSKARGNWKCIIMGASKLKYQYQLSMWQDENPVFTYMHSNIFYSH